MPIGMLLLAAVLAVVVLPSSLRPPPDQANTSAELSPNAPPEKKPDAIISSFTQAGSKTAGASRPTATGTTVTTTTPPQPKPVERPSTGQCYGDPPRQTESVYAPPCAPAFVGDNGGSTYRNVGADQVNIGFWHGASVPNNKGPVSSQPTPGEGGVDRTLRVLQAYFNQRYVTYGRRIQLVFIDTPDTSDAGQQAAAARADTEQHVFASTHLGRPYCDELVRRGLVCFNENPFPDADLEAAAPYFWSYQMSATRNERLMAEYVCKRLVGGTADFAGGTEKGKPRVFGVIYESNTTRRSFDDFNRAFESTCGQRAIGANVDDPSSSTGAAGQTALAVSQLRNQGVTTIIDYMQFGSQLVAMNAAQSSGYQPEWVVSGSYGDDFNHLGRLAPTEQMRHAFGMSGIELPRPRTESECYRAYRSIDPNNNPDDSVCDNYWRELSQIVGAIQLAGPNLTPGTFQQALFRYGYVYPPEKWAIDGGYGPGDHSYVDRMGEVWWDPSAVERGGTQAGAFKWTADGKRYGIGEVPAGPPAELFVSGIVSAEP